MTELGKPSMQKLIIELVLRAAWIILTDFFVTEVRIIHQQNLFEIYKRQALAPLNFWGITDGNYLSLLCQILLGQVPNDI